jgi:hypothetical protein
MNPRALTWLAALSGAASLVIWKAGDVLSALFTPEVATLIVTNVFQLTVILLIALASIGVGWTTAYLFRVMMLTPHPTEGWKPHTQRLMMCSFTWTAGTNFLLLLLRYETGHGTAKDIITHLAYNFVWTVVVGGISILAYDVVVKRLYPRLIRHFFPSKFVQTPSGVVERDADVPSDPTTEKTIMMDREPEPSEGPSEGDKP